MAGLEIRDLAVRYPGRTGRALDGVSLTVAPREVVGVTGQTGSGKSTLALAAAGLLPRVIRASVSGSVSIDGRDAVHASAADLAGRVGIAFSSPALQLSASKLTVREEIAFGLENLAVPRAEMDARIDPAMARLGIEHLAERDPLTLSGGEQQRVALASIIVMGTDILILDEPAAQLDPGGTEGVAAMLPALAAEGQAILVVEQAPEIMLCTKRSLVLDGGRVVLDAAPEIALASGEAAATGVDTAPAPASDVRGAAPVSLQVRGLRHTYEGDIEALRGVSLAFAPGETVAIVGQNGSGKTTLVKHLNGLLRPTSGTVELNGADIADRLVSDIAAQVGFVFQNPDDQIFNSRVDKEVAFGPRNLRLPAGDVERLVEAALELTGLSRERSTNPYDLDVSTRKLVALAGVLAMEPPLLVLDEPTMGQDRPGVSRIGGIVDAWAAAGRTVIAITHDMQFAARHFGRIVVMRRGEIVLDGTPATIFDAAHDELLASTGLRRPKPT
ncbi:MAG: energy-coupling factor transport system ATP-binding protein [Chloroflexota bacterium]|jgi:energy-coupling factor transport system ATP-binding protein|nr:energy-coupling factor transport system ATP-binding protein [Chloroflexota bacterium]